MQQYINLATSLIDSKNTARIEISDGRQTFVVTEEIINDEHLNLWRTNYSNKSWRYPTYAFLHLFKLMSKAKYNCLEVCLRFRTKAQIQLLKRTIEKYGYQYGIQEEV